MYGYQQEQQKIVFIKSLEDLQQNAEHQDYGAKFIFANYKVVDKTCNKELKFNVSLNKAEARKQRQLAYKKHANCEVVIEELHLIDNFKMSIKDIFGTEQHYWKIRNIPEDGRDVVNNPIKKAELIGFSNNINLTGTVKRIRTDKMINTRNGATRMMVIEFADENDDEIEITIWGDMAEGIVEGCSLEITKAELNTYENSRGLQIPRYGSVKVTSVPEKKVEQLVELPKDGLIMKLNFKSPKEVKIFLDNVTPEIRREDRVFTDFVNGSITIRNPTRYQRFAGMNLTELGSVENEPRSKRIEKLEGVLKDNWVATGVLNDGAYGAKHTVIKENFEYAVVKGEEDKRLSYKDKYSYKCGQCDEKYGYQSDAESCSRTHIPYGKMLGDYVKSVEITKDEKNN